MLIVERQTMGGEIFMPQKHNSATIPVCDDVATFKAETRCRKAAPESRKIEPGKMNWLHLNKMLQIGPKIGKQSDGKNSVNVMFALTKATGNNPHGEVVYCLPLNGNGKR